MIYHPDLSANPADGALRVGWLERGQIFAEGSVDSEFLQKLKPLYGHRVRQTRGFHVCPFCKERRSGVPMELDGKFIYLGSAEIEITDQEGRTYVAPDLLFHYVTEHRYFPPPDFVRAVRVGSVRRPEVR
jgi:hypothetical protein